MSSPGRRPPRAVLRELRAEVGFCCPVEDCGNPYLTWHHFDPPWRSEKHHRPEGMIALCREHADKADHGSFTDDQLRHLKKIGAARGRIVRARFDWMRHELLAVVGGNFYYKCPVIFRIGNVDCISFTRDDSGYLLLNLRMPTLATRPRARIEENVWSVVPTASEVITPPHGRRVEVRYANGDYFKIEFVPLASADALDARYRGRGTRSWSHKIDFPVTVVEIHEVAKGTIIEITPKSSLIGGIRLTNCFFKDFSTVILGLDASDEQIQRLFPDEEKWYEAMIAATENVNTEVAGTILFASSVAPANTYPAAAHALSLGGNVQLAPVPPPSMIVLVDIPESESFPLKLRLRLTSEEGEVVTHELDGTLHPLEILMEARPPAQYAIRGPGRRVRNVLPLDIPPVPLTPGRTYTWTLHAGELTAGTASFRVVSEAELATIREVAGVQTDKSVSRQAPPQRDRG